LSTLASPGSNDEIIRRFGNAPQKPLDVQMGIPRLPACPGGLAVGHDRFKDEIGLLTGRRVKEKK